MSDDPTPVDLLQSGDRRAGDLEIIAWLIKIDENQRSSTSLLVRHIKEEEIYINKLTAITECVNSLSAAVKEIRDLLPKGEDAKELLAMVVATARENKSVAGGVRVRFKQFILLAAGGYFISRVWPAAAAWLSKF